LAEFIYRLPDLKLQSLLLSLCQVPVPGDGLCSGTLLGHLDLAYDTSEGGGYKPGKSGCPGQAEQ